MQKTFKFYTDPGHGWLAVKITDLAKIGMSINDFSAYSYRRGGTVYLEEDCDAPLFSEKWSKYFNLTKFPHVVKYCEKNHPIRSYDRINSNWGY